LDLNVQQLNDHLDKTLAPVYLVSGDEPLQIEESLTLIRAKAREQGYVERQVLYVERSFDWSQLTEQSSNMSLFGDKKIVELANPARPVEKHYSSTAITYQKMCC
jgi:DNA polymerase-3 subunit delta